MGRPPLPPGTFGKVLFRPTTSGRVQARVKFRDFDGRVRLVTKSGPTQAAAERALKTELAARQNPATGGAITGATRVTELADAWLAVPHDWSVGTERTYRSVVQNHVKPSIGQLRVQEVTAGVVTRALRRIAERSGPGAARTAKACMSRMFAVAVEDGAAISNPVSGSSARVAARRRPPQALTPVQQDHLLGLFEASARARELDLPDLVAWMLATGCRIGEALAAREGLSHDGKTLLDLQAGTWEVNSTVVRVPRNGLIIQPRPKTDAGWRVIAVPPFAIELARQRLASNGGNPLLFPSPAARTLRDPTNASGDLREILDGFECRACLGSGYQVDQRGAFILNSKGRRARCDKGPWSWITSHTFRKTVATRLDDAGFTPRQVADHLGHANPSMTLDVYFGRQVVSAVTAQALVRAITH